VTSDTTGATLTAEFSYNRDFEVIASTKSVTGSGKNVSLSLTAPEVDSIKDSYYRIKYVKAAVTKYIQNGNVDYVALSIVNEKLATELVASQSFKMSYGPRPNTIALLGDSFTEMCVQQSGMFLTMGGGRGFWTWAAQLMRQRLTLVTRPGTLNGGVSGQTTAQIATRVKQDAVDLNPGWCHVLAGTNDASGGVPLTTTIANLTAIYDDLSKAGIRIVAGTIAPKSSATTAQLRAIEAINTWIRKQGQIRSGFIVADYHARLAGPTGGWRVEGNTAYTADGIHPSSGGALRMGRVLADALNPYLPATVPFLPTSNIDDGASGATEPNLLPNSMFTGTTGVVGAGATGQAPTSWRIDRNGGAADLTGVALSIVARTDGMPGNWWQITNATTAPFWRIAYTPLAPPAVGKILQCAVEYELENVTDIRVWRAQVTAFDQAAGFANRGTAYDGDPAASDVGVNPFPYSELPAKGIFLTRPMAYPANATGLTFAVDFQGVGTIRLARPMLRVLSN
jgi:lysophospholipase L1-like esterase